MCTFMPQFPTSCKHAKETEQSKKKNYDCWEVEGGGLGGGREGGVWWREMVVKVVVEVVEVVVVEVSGHTVQHRLFHSEILHKLQVVCQISNRNDNCVPL